ncbi:hypothetical protein SEA_CEN1621_45 [Microbacterium phage Cen1621]|uniref:Uncharacterized protein n=1 Tax=Microbacterium phage Cen1621 TaxID=2965191 RepID=A0A9E7QAX2_9CAUD|nr:hypothetical protein SEA_CEN1621_45 [Microbacterium phage Cen1621]
MTEQTGHRELFQNLADASERAAKGLIAAAAIQWQPGARLKGIGGGKGKGTVSNPTFDIVADPKRLKVRAAVIAAERDLARAARVLDARAEQLARAVAEWEGETSL